MIRVSQFKPKLNLNNIDGLNLFSNLFNHLNIQLEIYAITTQFIIGLSDEKDKEFTEFEKHR